VPGLWRSLAPRLGCYLAEPHFSLAAGAKVLEPRRLAFRYDFSKLARFMSGVMAPRPNERLSQSSMEMRDENDENP
jgi:hypothetical protein